MRKTTHDPRKSVLRQLAKAHDNFAEQEQVLLAEGRFVESQGAHELAIIILRAYTAEMDDPEVPDA